MIYAGLLICSLFILQNVSVGYLPTLDSRKILIKTEFKGAEAELIRESVTCPLEKACLLLENHRNITSISRDELSLIQIEFHNGTDMDVALLKAKETIDSAFENLPYGCKKSTVKFIETNCESMNFSVTSESLDNTQLRFYAENSLAPKLQRIKGISDISIYGGDKSEIQIILDKDKLFSKKITITDVATACNLSNGEFSVGNFIEGENIHQIKIEGNLKDESDFENIIISHSPVSGDIRVKDVGKVEIKNQEKISFAELNGKECILFSVKYNKSESPIKVSNRLKKQLKEFSIQNNDEMEITILEDSAKNLENELERFIVQGSLGFLITAICLAVFYKSIVLSIVVSITIPLCLIYSMALLTMTGNSLNSISISGLTLGIGMAVDCSAVAAESILSSKNIFKGTRKILISNLGSTATTIIAFIPVFLIYGPIKEMFSCLSLAVIGCVGFSFLVSCSLTVSLLTLIKNKNDAFIELLKFESLKSSYKKTLLKFFHRPQLIIVATVIFLLSGIVLLSVMKIDFTSKNDTEKVSITVKFPANVTLAYIQDTEKYYYKKLKEIPGLKKITIYGGDDYDIHELSSTSLWSNKIVFDLYIGKTQIEPLKRILEPLFVGVEIDIDYESFSFSKNLVNSMGKYFLESDSLDQLNKNIESLQSSGIFKFSPDENYYEWDFVPSIELLSEYSIGSDYVVSEMSHFINGIELEEFEGKSRKYPIKVLLKKENENIHHLLKHLTINVQGIQMPISFLGELKETKKEKIFLRENLLDAKIISNDFIRDEKNPDYKIWDANAEVLNAIKKEFILLIIFVCLLIYILLGIIFQSFEKPFIVCFAMIFSIPGALFALFIAGKTLDLNALISFVILLGLSANNSILLMESVSQSSTLNVGELIEKCCSKLNALLITNGTTVLSLIPFVFTSSISISIIGGLCFSLPLTAISIPVFVRWRIK